MAKTEEEYIELLNKANKVIKKQREIIEQFKIQVDWAINLLEQNQKIIESQQETNKKLMDLLEEA